MAFWDTGLDILTGFLHRCGELFPGDALVSNAARLPDAKNYCMSGYWDFAAYRPWRWARANPPAQFASLGKLDNLGVTSIVDATVTLNAPLTPSVAGRKLVVYGDGIPARILTHAAGSAVLILQAPYTGALLSGPAFVFMDEIVVTTANDILAFPNVQELHTGDRLLVIPEDEFRGMFPRNILDNPRAQYATFITMNAIRIGPWTTQPRLFECAYNQLPPPLTFDGVAATDTPVCPRNQRELIGLFALKKLMADKRDARVKIVMEEIAEKLSIQGGIEVSFQKPRASVPPGKRVYLQ